MSANKPFAEGSLAQAKTSLLEPAGIGEAELERLFLRLMSRRVDYADVYFQYSRHEAWSLEEGRGETGSHNIDPGVGVGAVSGEETGLS